MIATMRMSRCAIFAAAICFSLSACTVTETVSEGLGTTKDILSSTTPGVWFTGDGLLKADHKVTAFVAFNFENLKQDMAAGRGEYLESAGDLLAVPAAERRGFFSAAQGHYGDVTNHGQPAQLVALLRHAAGISR